MARTIDGRPIQYLSFPVSIDDREWLESEFDRMKEQRKEYVTSIATLTYVVLLMAAHAALEARHD